MSVFISHSHKDKRFVEWLANSLAASGIDVWYDDWEIKVGDSILEKVNEGISQSDFLIVVLSKSSVNSRWVREELNAASAEMIEKAGIKILPVLIEDVELPILLRHRKYADFRNDQHKAFKELLDVLLPPVEMYWRELGTVSTAFNRLVKEAKRADTVVQKLPILIEINSLLEQAVDLRYRVEALNRGETGPESLTFVEKHEYLLKIGFELRSSSWVRLRELRNRISHYGASPETKSIEGRVKRIVLGIDELRRMMNRLRSANYP